MNNFNTDAIATHNFRPHGRVDISIHEEGIIKYLATGPFNKELAEVLAEMDNHATQIFKLKFGQWCELITFQHSCMALEDSLVSLEHHLLDKKDRKIAQLASAFVFTPDIEGHRFMAKKYEQCYRRAGITYRSFNNEKDALKWARACRPKA